jgi:hypothetical protein
MDLRCVQRQGQTPLLKPHHTKNTVTGPNCSLRTTHRQEAGKMTGLMMSVVVAFVTGMVVHTVWFR